HQVGPLISNYKLQIFTICWDLITLIGTIFTLSFLWVLVGFKSKKPEVYLKSAGIPKKRTKFVRHFSLNNTPEIICESPFNLKEFYDKHKYVDPLWLGWFIGFTEGDGSFILGKSGRITFVITQKNPSVLYHI
uniref:LAGLIDADG endonuclease n=1 Tax=Ramaria cf. rubripermanens TaxID=2016387 RepID=UPI0022385F03